MGEMILEAEIKVSRKTHKKKTKKGEHEYHYGSFSIDNPALLPFVGKTVKVRVEESKVRK